MNTHVVTKSLPHGEDVLQPGTEVDASGWRHTRTLEEQRYLRPLGAVATVLSNLKANGELASALAGPIQPNERDKRMGRKDNKDGNTGN